MNVGISVSRVGSSAQTKAMKSASGTIKSKLAQYRELAAFAKFGSDLDAATQSQLALGERLTELLKQPQYAPLLMEEQVAVIYAGMNGFLGSVPTAQVGAYERGLLAHLRTKHAKWLGAIRDGGALTDPLKKELEEILTAFGKTFA